MDGHRTKVNPLCRERQEFSFTCKIPGCGIFAQFFIFMWFLDQEFIDVTESCQTIYMHKAPRLVFETEVAYSIITGTI